jgi:hypothetical protein
MPPAALAWFCVPTNNPTAAMAAMTSFFMAPFPLSAFFNDPVGGSR